MKHIAALLLLALLTGCATCADEAVGVERRKLHAGGFCEATLEVTGDFGFESVGHFNHCFYKSRDFGQCDAMSVAPSGSVALWQESSTGSIVAYRPGWQAPAVLKGFPTSRILKSVTWDETTSSVVVAVWDHPETYNLAIPGGG